MTIFILSLFCASAPAGRLTRMDGDSVASPADPTAASNLVRDEQARCELMFAGDATPQYS